MADTSILNYLTIAVNIKISVKPIFVIYVAMTFFNIFFGKIYLVNSRIFELTKVRGLSLFSEYKFFDVATAKCVLPDNLDRLRNEYFRKHHTGKYIITVVRIIANAFYRVRKKENVFNRQIRAKIRGKALDSRRDDKSLDSLVSHPVQFYAVLYNIMLERPELQRNSIITQESPRFRHHLPI